MTNTKIELSMKNKKEKFENIKARKKKKKKSQTLKAKKEYSSIIIIFFVRLKFNQLNVWNVFILAPNIKYRFQYNPLYFHKY